MFFTAVGLGLSEAGGYKRIMNTYPTACRPEMSEYARDDEGAVLSVRPSGADGLFALG